MSIEGAGRRRPREWRMIASQESPAVLLPARLISTGEGYAMVRRRNGFPFVVAEHDWISAPVQQHIAT